MDFPLSRDITRIEKNFLFQSDSSFIDTQDIPMDSALKAAGWVDGQWVKTSGTTSKTLSLTDGTPVKNSFCVYTGSETLTDPTTDTKATGMLTVITSKGWIAKTKKFTGTPAIGALLVADTGNLREMVAPVALHDFSAELPFVVAMVVGPIVDGYLEFQAL